MLTDKQIADALALIDERYHKVIQKYLKMVGRTVLKIGELNQRSINLLIQLRRMGVDVQTIEKELRNATRLTQSDIRKLYKKAAEEANTDARFEYITKGVEPDNNRWNELVESIWRQTAGTMANLSNTTSISEEYKEVISEAVQAVSMGVTDYKAAIRDSIKRLGGSGIRVEYESGYKRRLDTAVRQNVLDGVRQIQLESQKLIGEEIGADGVEITAHQNSAPDHEPVQGRQFDIENFERMQSAQPFEDADGNWYKPFERPIREWNCRHFVHYIILGVSKRMYSDEQLEKWKKENREGCDIGGKHYTKYEATQLMRKIETAIRKQKDTAILAQASGDDVLRRECQSNITQLTSKYDQVAKAAGLRARPEKTFVKGFIPINEDDKEAESFFGVSGRDRLTDIVKRSTIKLENGFACFPDGDPLTENAKNVKPLKTYFDVAMHGTPTGVCFGSNEENMSPRLLASIIRHSDGYEGQKIRLLCCSTGKIIGDEYCFAEELANALGVPVKAPNDVLYISNRGGLKVREDGTGKFVDYLPNERRRLK